MSQADEFSFEELESAQKEFDMLVPAIVSDPRFSTGVTNIEGYGLIPLAYLDDGLQDSEMPDCFVMVFAKDRLNFLSWHGPEEVELGESLSDPEKLIPDSELEQTILAKLEEWYTLFQEN